MKASLANVLLALGLATFAGSQQQSTSGMVLNTDVNGGVVVVSAAELPGDAEGGVLTLHVVDRKQLESLHAGDNIQFQFTRRGGTLYANAVTVHPFEAYETDPSQARRLRLLAKGLEGLQKATKAGQLFPDFELVDQNGRPVRLRDFKGKVVAISFMYTRCALPNFCYRLSNNLGQLQKRFHDVLGRELVLLTITFDPVHDHPEELASYAVKWKADPRSWHFLTGNEQEIHKVCDAADVDYFTDEGLFAHSLHTLVLNRQGKLVANLEGNQFTAKQLGDLVQTTIDER
jgi:protein SCO1/2